MQIEYFRYIVMTAKCDTITEAAERLHLSQTTLSAAIKNVEVTWGITIFERTRRGVNLTPEGEVFVAHSQKLLNQYEEMQRLMKNSHRKTLHLAAHHLASDRYSVEIARKFNQVCMSTSLRIVEISRRKILRSVATGEYRYGIGYSYLPEVDLFLRTAESEGIKCEFLSTDTRYLYVGQDSYLAQLPKIEMGDLENAHFAITEQGMAEFERSGLRKSVKNYTVFSNIHLARQAIEQGDMCAFYLSDDTPEDWFNRGTTIKKLAMPEQEKEQAQHFLLYRADRPLTKNEQMLLHCVREVFLK